MRKIATKKNSKKRVANSPRHPFAGFMQRLQALEKSMLQANRPPQLRATNQRTPVTTRQGLPKGIAPFQKKPVAPTGTTRARQQKGGRKHGKRTISRKK